MKTPTKSNDRVDVLVVGDGIIGLSIALGIARAGGTCQVVGKMTDGQASTASAGLLAPSLGNAEPGFRTFMRASRDRYPEWIRWLSERTGIEVTLNRLGILEIESESAGVGSTHDADARLVDASELHTLEPALVSPARAVLHADDGFVDNVALLRALREALRCEWSAELVDGRGASVDPVASGCSVRTEDGRTLEAGNVVVAGGAWSPLVAGVARHLKVEPVRGQIVILEGCPLTHAVAAADAYLVPRGGRTLVGSTLERVGFDTRTTVAARDHLRSAAVAAVPELEEARVVDHWAGLRPMSPDGQPILGRDPSAPRLIYACGHGKNGILLAPLTAECIVALVAGSAMPFEIAQFSIERFYSDGHRHRVTDSA